MRIVSCAPKGFSKFNILASAALAVMLAACSSSVERFADNPSNADPVYTASVQKPKRLAYAAPEDDAITSRPLASAPLKTPSYANNSYNYNNSYSYKKPAYKQPSYQAEAPDVQQPTYNKPIYTNTAMNKPAISKIGSVRVEQGMTLYSIAKANGVTVAQLASANGIAPPYSVSTGRVLRIPGVAHAMAPKTNYTNENGVASNAQDNAPAMPAKMQATGGMHRVASGETLFSLGRKYGVSPYAIADLNHLPHDKALILGQNIHVPAGSGQSFASKAPAATDAESIASSDDEAAPVNTGKSLTLKQPVVAEEIPAAKPAAQQVAELNANPTAAGMRWPVKGKVISEFGAKPNGLKNEGINISVPEGTGIRAAESGVVAYAGNELKGYGNLVLIRHEGGWVTAYAHAKELFVKRGDTVKRGDVIAKAGQTGSVSSPQLHFEVRKGATAMDPMKFLSSTTASN